MDNVSLIIRDGDGTERVIDLSPGTTQLGRSEDVDITLPSQSVSRLHAQVVVEEHEVRIEDLESGNGITHRGQRVSSMTLNDGHQIFIDPYTLIFRIPDVPDTDVLDRTMTNAHLEIIHGAGLSANHIVLGPAKRLTIGRAEDQDVILPDRSASRLHCILEEHKEGWCAIDAGSANGLLVNQQKIERQTLKSGDLLQVGDTVFRFVDPNGTQPMANNQGAKPAETPKDRRALTWALGCGAVVVVVVLPIALLIGVVVAIQSGLLNL